MWRISYLNRGLKHEIEIESQYGILNAIEIVLAEHSIVLASIFKMEYIQK